MNENTGSSGYMTSKRSGGSYNLYFYVIIVRNIIVGCVKFLNRLYTCPDVVIVDWHSVRARSKHLVLSTSHLECA